VFARYDRRGNKFVKRRQILRSFAAHVLYFGGAALIISAASLSPLAFGATVHVPREYSKIQAAVDAASAGDVVLVAPGRYLERLVLKPGITVRSEGDDSPGSEGLKRAESTIIDGGGKTETTAPGVEMAEGSTLDGFTITNVGLYDDALWKKHFDSQGEELGDEEGAVHAEGTQPAVRIRGVTCVVRHCIVHHNGDVGIGILGIAELGKEQSQCAPLIAENCVFRNLGGGIGVAEGAEPIVRGNRCRENLRAGIGCRQANPMIIANRCYQNIRAGIGCREGSRPIVRDNQCFQNRRAGIGIRMEGTSPVVEGNECYENWMAGIGSRDGASPVLRNNICRKNKMAGIGSRDGARPIMIGNECRENELAGIGLEGDVVATILKNRCLDNRLVAIGVTRGSVATISDNELSRTGGMPPLIAIKDGSMATISGNRLTGGGVAAVLVQGKATVSGNKFMGVGDKQGNAVWVWENSHATIEDNTFDSYRSAVNSTKANVVIRGNTVLRFQTAAIVVRDSQSPCHVFANTAVSALPTAKVMDIQGATGVVEGNTLKAE
jgi:parallel beta-helix repeat protein